MAAAARTPERVVIFGGANIDIAARAAGPLDPHSSTPGRVHAGDGGVARNIAENLARLGSPVALVTAFGADADGLGLHERCVGAGIDVRCAVFSQYPSSRYVALLDEDGELVQGINDMRAIETLTPTDIAAALAAIGAGDLIVVDANLPVPVLTVIAAAAALAGAPVVAEPVSVAKAGRVLAGVLPRPWLVTPNADEVRILAARGDAAGLDPVADAACLLALGMQHVWVRLGPAGSVLVSGDAAEPVVTDLPARDVEVVDVTGGGDALLAGFLHALLGGADLAAAAAYGHDVAALAVTDRHTVRPDLTPALVERFRTDAKATPP